MPSSTADQGFGGGSHNPQALVADRAAAEALAELYPGADVVRLPFASLIPEANKLSRKRVHASDAARNAAYRDRRKADLLTQLEEVNRVSSETKLPYTYKDISSLTNAAFGGSLFHDVGRKHPAAHVGFLAPADFMDWLRELHSRRVEKEHAWLWSPAEFERKDGVATGRGLANITAIWGIWMDNDGGDLSTDEFAAIFPHLMMVIHNSASSTPDAPRWRAIIATTCAMTIDVHREIMLQIRQALNRRRYFDKRQLAKRSAKGLSGKCHGFDPSKYTAASMFYLPAQATAGPDASFFLTFDGGTRQAINPYQWIDRTIIDHRPLAEPAETAQPNIVRVAPPTKCPKLQRMRELIAEEEEAKAVSIRARREADAIERWRMASPGEGNRAFFRLACQLAGLGMSDADISSTLWREAGNGRHPSERRAQIKYIMRSPRGFAFRMAA